MRQYDSERQVKGAFYGKGVEIVDRCMTSFSFGRNSGHTENAIEYIKNHKNAFLIVNLFSQKSFVIDFKCKCFDISNRIISITESENSVIKHFSGFKSVELIFDSITNEDDIRKFLINSIDVDKVSALCKIGS